NLDQKFTVSSFSLIFAKVVASIVFDFIVDEDVFLTDSFYSTRDDGGIHLLFSVSAKREETKNVIKVHLTTQAHLNDRQVNVEA
ncbi:MAG: hypothetical protein HQK88_17165, partial [Nitrospirae bacterium]|nr:hypothetical protein [Nitrospirota bacterium]